MGVTYEMGEGGRGFNFVLGTDGLKGRLENVDGLGSELANLSGVSISELVNWEIVLNTAVLVLVSDSVLDKVL